MPATLRHRPRPRVSPHRIAAHRRSGDQQVHSSGLLNTAVCLPRFHPQLPLTLALGNRHPALEVLSPILSPTDTAIGGQGFLDLAIERFTQPFAHLLTQRNSLIVGLCDSPEAYHREVSSDDDKNLTTAAVIISLGTYFHYFAYAGQYLESLPRPLAQWLAAFLTQQRHTIGPGDYKGYVEMINWGGGEDEASCYTEWGTIEEFDEWEKLTAADKALAEKSVETGDLDTLERLMKPPFPTLREFNAEYPEWVRMPGLISGDQTKVLEEIEKADPELASALRPFFPNGCLTQAPKGYIIPEGFQGAIALALWKRHDLINQSLDEEYERAMNANDGHLCFARIDLAPSAKSIATAQATVHAVLQYYHGLIKVHEILDKREPHTDDE